MNYKYHRFLPQGIIFYIHNTNYFFRDCAPRQHGTIFAISIKEKKIMNFILN